MSSADREPSAFALDDPRLQIEAEIESEPLPASGSVMPPVKRSSGNWWRIFLSAAGGLLILALLLWIEDTIFSLLSRHDWLGWVATILLAVAAFAFFMILMREALGLLRLSAMTALRKRAEGALISENAREARAAESAIRATFANRPELGHGLRRLRQHDRDILDAKQIFALTERELLLPLDRSARMTIGFSGRRVSVVTSISPTAILAVGFVAYENFKMLRTLATIYGGRPGFFAILKLLRLIAGHLAVTGGLALTDDLVQQFIGHGLTARLSHRLGEGLVNGGFTIRIGLAAVEVLRPLPYIEARRPRLREFLTEFLRFGQRQDKTATNIASSKS